MTLLRVSALASTLLLFFACASPSQQQASKSPAREFATTPYTAEQIRDSNPPGTVVTYKIFTPGSPDLLSVFEFGDSNEDSVMLAARITGLDGKQVQDTSATRVPWHELRDHARFPASACSKSEARISTPAGEFDCWLYTVDDAEHGTVNRFWFAKQRAGSPVVMTVMNSGTEVYRMELQSVRSPI